jgi:hypothetical protein
MALLAGSRYLLTQVVEQRARLTGKPVRPPFLDFRPRVTRLAPDDVVFIPDVSMGWANLGVSHLRDAGAWWAIADINGIIDPFEELIPGNRYRSPSLTRYQFNIRPGDHGAGL